MAHDNVGEVERARQLFGWSQALRHHDGSYWTGVVYPELKHFPGGERTTYTAATIVLADDALWGDRATSGLFRGEGLPVPFETVETDADIDVVDVSETVADPPQHA